MNRSDFLMTVAVKSSSSKNDTSSTSTQPILLTERSPGHAASITAGSCPYLVHGDRPSCLCITYALRGQTLNNPSTTHPGYLCGRQHPRVRSAHSVIFIFRLWHQTLGFDLLSWYTNVTCLVTCIVFVAGHACISGTLSDSHATVTRVGGVTRVESNRAIN